MSKVGRPQIYSILVASLLLQVTILDRVGMSGVKPDIVLISLVFSGLFLGKRTGLEAGIAAGILKDTFALDFFGVNTAILALVGYLSGYIGENVSRESVLTRTIATAALTAVSMSLHFFLVAVFSKWLSIGFGEYFIYTAIPASLYTSLVSIPVYHVLIRRYDLRGSEDYL